jgi:adenylate kinase
MADNKITNIVVTGKSGAGKQPRIDVLKDEFNLEQLSTGDIYRKLLKKFNEYGYTEKLDFSWDKEKNHFIDDELIAEKIGTQDEEIILGLKAKYFVENGLFGPDYITNALFENEFAKKGFKNQILDGYPRTMSQSKFLLELIKKHDSKIDFIVLVDNSNERIIKRTVNRRICPVDGKVYHLIYKPPVDGKCSCGEKVIQRSDDTEEKIKSRLNEFREKALPAINYLKNNGDEFTPENVRKSVMDEVNKIL